QVDGVDAQPLERRVAGGADVLRPAVHAPETAVRAAHIAELLGQRHLVAPACDGAADERFVRERAVHIGGVQEGDSQVEGPVNRGDGFGVVPTGVELGGGHAKIQIADRRRVRNHLNSVHAVALANLAEVTSGLALLTGLPPNVRGIPVRLSIAYLKKARGRLTAEARCPLPDTSVDAEHDFEAVISDSSGDVVARATVRWRLGPAPTP